MSVSGPASGRTSLRDVVGAYVGLTKPRVIELLLLTTVPVMFFAERGVPPLGLVVATVVGGTLSAGSANALNCVYDRDIDEQMRRTRRRALPRHIVTPRAALVFGLVLVWSRRWCSGSSSTGCRPGSRWRPTRSTSSATRWCSSGVPPRTSSGAALAGCFPALIGWTAVTGELAWPPVVLFLVVFFWTPPHTWALAMRYREDYAPGRRADAAGGAPDAEGWRARSWPTPG